jgi:hypothetical protein
MTYFLAAVAASGIFIAAGWRSKNAKAKVSKAGSHGVLDDALWAEPEAAVSNPDDAADVGAVIRQVLKRLAPLIASHSVLADVAARPGLQVSVKAAALSDLLEELVTASIHSAPASRLLILAKRDAEHVYVAITDDMPGADHAVRQGRIRGLIERVASRGGVLDISVRPEEGTTMTLRLAAMPDARQRGARGGAQPSGASADPANLSARENPLPTATPV